MTANVLLVFKVEIVFLWKKGLAYQIYYDILIYNFIVWENLVRGESRQCGGPEKRWCLTAETISFAELEASRRVSDSIHFRCMFLFLHSKDCIQFRCMCTVTIKRFYSILFREPGLCHTKREVVLYASHISSPLSSHVPPLVCLPVCCHYKQP